MIDDRFIIQLQGKNFVTYEGLLDQAHKNGLESIHVEIVQLPTNENNMTAVCRATAKSGNMVFTDFGDASPASVGKNIVPHILRMASTRAKARALRDLTNIGITAGEERDLTDKEEIVFENSPPTKRQLETIKDLSHNLNISIDTGSLTKKTAGSLISDLIDRKQNKH